MELQGLFWKPDPPKSSERVEPPNPVWLSDDYLPGLDEARRFDVPMMDDAELIQAQANGEELVCDCETYSNYFLAAFTSMASGKCFYFEIKPCDVWSWSPIDLKKLGWVLRNFRIITFNGINFDLPILALALDGRTPAEMKHAAAMMIVQEVKAWQMLKSFKVEPLEIDHIDLIEVAPLSGSLKIYAGRVHAPRMQDLPFDPEKILSEDQIAILKYYCINDLTSTAFLRANLEQQISIRVGMSQKYGVDLRSKSDAQVAEAVIKSELEKLNGFKPKRPEIFPGTSYLYHPPAFLKFQTPELQNVLTEISRAQFLVSESGSIITPPELYDPATLHKSYPKPRRVRIALAEYKLGIGGLHSCEECQAVRADENFKLADRDVASYYPAIILNQSLHPIHLGFDFINVYRSLVERRLKAKKSGNKIEADMLKIVINGSFGKFGSKWSALYAPDLLIQTTLTGQLSLLLLIERLELNGIQVISANTDGIVMKFPRVMQDVCNRVVSDWERETNFITEETEYSGLMSRDVNNYIALKPDGSTKTKGAYFSPWGQPGLEIFRFHKNPTNSICVEAVTEYLTKGTPISETVRNCGDFTKFLTVRKVNGGAVKDGVYLGKAIRWYYANGCGGFIVYASSGNKVPKSDGAKPCLQMPDSFPPDIDFRRYEGEAFGILKEIGVFDI